MPEDYTLLDATLEILLMLLAAFLLGWLFCWLMKKLFGRKQKDTIEYTHDANSADLNIQASRPERTGLSASSRERLYDPEVGIPRGDIDADIPTINEAKLGSINIDTPDLDLPDADINISRPRIDIPDLKAPDVSLPDLDLKGKVDAGLDASKGALGKGFGVAAAGVGALAVGAGSLKDKAVGAIDGIDLDLKKPEIDVPDVSISAPDISTPEIDLPEVPEFDVSAEMELPKVPDLDVSTDMELPEISTPSINTDINLPDVSLPDLDTDFTAGLELPEVDLPDLDIDAKLPDLETPDIKLPEIDMPDVSGDLNLPKVDLESLKAKVDLPDVNLPDLDTNLDLPAVDLPSADLDLDGLDLPKPPIDLDTPEIDLPSIKTPDISGAADATIESGKGFLSKGLGAAAAGIGAVTAGAVGLKDKAADKAEALGDSLTSPDLPKRREPSTTIDDGRISEHSSEDNLTRITGIDSSMEKLLNSKGINTYEQLRKTDRSTLKAYIDEAGDDNLSGVEPASWPHQAKLCADKNWVKLSEYQSFLSGTSTDLTDTSSGASFDDTVKDDLKKIEGIGPFFESLLNKAGITTYEQLKDSSRDSLKEIIDAAGPDYRMHEPETWPYQAGLADRGDWKKLQDYIHFMTGRN